jgi:hypothetical protein
MNNAIKILVLLVTMSWTMTAQAETFSLWVTGKTGVAGASDNAFKRFDSQVGSGAEAGLELFSVSLFGEAINMGTNQMLLTANLGWDTSWGTDWRFNLGFFTGPVVMMFPNAQNGVETPSPERVALEEQGIDTSALDAELDNGFLMREEELAKLNLGWNLLRTRLQFERRLFPTAYLGISFDGAYHMVATGEEVAAGAKHMMLNQMQQRQGLDTAEPAMEETLRAEIGAEALDPSKMGGFNYNVGAYLKFQI